MNLQIDLAMAELSWCLDILKRIKETLDDPNKSDESKIEITRWLVKQALKVERESWFVIKNVTILAVDILTLSAIVI